MKLGDILDSFDKKEAPTPIVVTEPLVPEPSVIDQIALVHLAERAIEAIDMEREAKARAAIARQDLEAALDAMKVVEVEALGRTLKFKSTSKPDLTLKAIKALLPEDEAMKLWNNLPRKTYRSLEVPKSAEGEPDVE